ncbi:MAG: sulfate transporter family-domain-containing protein [Benjaminiella poitrasii]|nr:MAG: sulfate transporter family-domain-containing protein [Benjaminiella poitrasii]
MVPASNSIIIDYSSQSSKQKISRCLQNLPRQTRGYITSLFPIIQWIHRYNLSWLIQDIIAGITVGMLIVPQGIAYAKVANLDPQYGLYTSFVGVTLYCIFGTSKDISIGPITVVSLLVGQAITKVTEVHPEITGPEVAVCLSLFAGLVTIMIGLVKLGILVDFISEPAIAGYMTGSAITISLGQWPKLFGLKGVSTHQAPYLIFYDFFKSLKETRLDAAFGITALIILYLIKYISSRPIQNQKQSSWLARLKRSLFFLGIMRSGLIVIAGTLISYFINRNHLAQPQIAIIQKVPAGFDAMAVPRLEWTILKEASGVLPSIILILILEHVSVAKSFGRMNDYVINPNQEILAIGMSNVIGSFFGAYPCTGAFSRTAVMARSGAKTPIAGVFSGAVVVLALYALTPAFYYIPEAVLAAVVIHAVIDLISGPRFLRELWKSSCWEFIIYVVAVVVTCFVDVETGIYIAVALSLFLMLINLARPSVTTLGRVKLSKMSPGFTSNNNKATTMLSKQPSSLSSPNTRSYTCLTGRNQTPVANDALDLLKESQYIYVNEHDPHFTPYLEQLPFGIIAIRLSQSMLYPNAGYISERIVELVKERTRPGQQEHDVSSTSTPTTVWSELQPKNTSEPETNRPILEYIVLDMGAVSQLDATAIHTLRALRHTLSLYAGDQEGNESVEWHFCQITNPRVRQALINAGFGQVPQEVKAVRRSSLASMLPTLSLVNRESRPISPVPDELPEKEDPSVMTIHSLRDPMGMDLYYDMMSIKMEDDYRLSTIVEENRNLGVEKSQTVDMLPKDRYAAFHWNVESAIYSICLRRQSANKQESTHNPSSITVTVC